LTLRRTRLASEDLMKQATKVPKVTKVRIIGGKDRQNGINKQIGRQTDRYGQIMKEWTDRQNDINKEIGRQTDREIMKKGQTDRMALIKRWADRQTE
jgi:hypothetical protein